ncbi:hypothetical protein [Nocardioides pyridinolyticus]
MTPAEVCGAGTIPVTFEVASTLGSGGATDPISAVGPWVGPREDVAEVGQSPSGEALMSVRESDTGSVLRVLSVGQFRKEWFITATTACGSLASGASCGVSIDFSGSTYSRDPAQPPNLGVGRPLGQAQTSPCFGFETGDGVAQFAQPVRPVTAFQANEQEPSQAVAVNVEGEVVLLRISG